MKFGGTSVRDQAIRFQALNHIRREVNDHYKVVVVFQQWEEVENLTPQIR